MIVEIRRYQIVPGKRDEFIAFFDAEVAPAMRAAGMNIMGRYASLEDDTTFVFLRSFADEAERAAQTEAFYGSPAWLDDIKDRALAMETDWTVDVVTDTP